MCYISVIGISMFVLRVIFLNFEVEYMQCGAVNVFGLRVSTR